ncbi:DUF6175 family protein [Parabacteroides chongii]|uniref:DUF6175 family protein n=1 Tax=Parabacteroides chongii TaxID=2685834 RepID=UPI00240E5B55|nr:DUF6175 family protein [Parabacteroides chongii]WFE84692.1 DUF6175 family protein [Parabacteroides chongii]
MNIKIHILFIVFWISSLAVYGQARKPKLMVIPSDSWCRQNHCMTQYDDQGLVSEVANYNEAVKNKDLRIVISTINNLMKDRGFELEDLEATLKKLETSKAEDELITSKSGSTISESPFDQIRKRAKPDIILDIDYTINWSGPEASITYDLRGMDAATNKQIAGSNGVGNPSFSAEIASMLREAVQSNMNVFSDRLQKHFEDMAENGREVIVEIKLFENSEVDFESEFGDDELYDIIKNWMTDNTVKGRYSIDDATETHIRFSQVRIPLYDEDGRAMDTRDFTNSLRKYLRKDPYRIPGKIVLKSLGESLLIIGEK